MKVVYIAGPFRAENAWEVEQNIRRAEELSLELWREGIAAICPHTNTRFFQGAAPDDVWLAGYLEVLRRCDAVLTVDEWTHSAGAQAEVEEAQRCGVKVFFYIGACLDFCHERGLYRVDQQEEE